jgi:acyl carrier protein
MAKLFDKIQRIIVDQFGVDAESITPSTSFVEDLNADTSDLAELITVIEQKFSNSKLKLEIPTKDIESFFYIQDLVDYLNEHLNED